MFEPPSLFFNLNFQYLNGAVFTNGHRTLNARTMEFGGGINVNRFYAFTIFRGNAFMITVALVKWFCSL